jgi:hypothetical protein
MQSFGVRQLAATFLPASLLAGTSSESTIPSQQAGSSQSGSKLPHSKAGCARTSYEENFLGEVITWYSYPIVEDF